MEDCLPTSTSCSFSELLHFHSFIFSANHQTMVKIERTSNTLIKTFWHEVWVFKLILPARWLETVHQGNKQNHKLFYSVCENGEEWNRKCWIWTWIWTLHEPLMNLSWICQTVTFCLSSFIFQSGLPPALTPHPPTQSPLQSWKSSSTTSHHPQRMTTRHLR